MINKIIQIVFAVGVGSMLHLGYAAPQTGNSSSAILGPVPPTTLGDTPLRLVSGKSQVVPIPGGITRVSVANPEMADVTVIAGRELYAIGRKVGSTNIFLWGKSGQVTVMDVIISTDTLGLQGKLRELMPTEQQLHVSSAGEALVLIGQVADAAKVQRAMEIAEQFTEKKVINLLSMGELPQVLLEVKVAEVSRKLTDKLGVALGVNGSRGSFQYQILGNLLTGGAFSTPQGGGAGIGLAQGNDSLRLEAEIKNGLIKVLAEPNIIAVSGQEGAFLAGGKIFIPVPRSDGSGIAYVTLEEREYGVGLRFLPTVLEGGKINLRVTPEVSELVEQGTPIKAGGVTNVLPTISTRRASTTVQLMDGQSFAIGGLIKNNVSQSLSGFPFLSELPVLGALFRSSEFINDRSELMFLVTPRLVKPMATSAPLPTDGFIAPTRYEFMMNGQMQGRSPVSKPPARIQGEAAPAVPVVPLQPPESSAGPHVPPSAAVEPPEPQGSIQVGAITSSDLKIEKIEENKQ
ncbi:MAG: type II and III secretion system protein family protein [Burkholderiaceae bacterium]|jgi:pilus assembly protein CpaC|nr:type II and III secretion system protein family protein [Burkholderiaceae bacterium]